MGASAVASAVGVVLSTFVYVGVIAYLVHRFMSARKRKQEYRKLQYEYALSRFLKDEFEAYVGGVEGR